MVVHIQYTWKETTNPYSNLNKNKPYLHLSIALDTLELECYLKITAFCLSWKTGVSLPSLKSNQILFLYFSPILFFSFTLHTLIFNPHIHYICIFLKENILRTSHICVAILLTKLEKGLSRVRALNVVISRRYKALLNWTNQTKTQSKKDLDSGVYTGDSGIPGNGFRIQIVKFQGQGFRIPQKNSRIPDSRFWNPDYHWVINGPLELVCFVFPVEVPGERDSLSLFMRRYMFACE